jgi:hypothetical protein
MFQTFSVKEQKRNNIDKSYRQYIRFIDTENNKVMISKKRDGYKPTLSTSIHLGYKRFLYEKKKSFMKSCNNRIEI